MVVLMGRGPKATQKGWAYLQRIVIIYRAECTICRRCVPRVESLSTLQAWSHQVSRLSGWHTANQAEPFPMHRSLSSRLASLAFSTCHDGPRPLTVIALGPTGRKGALYIPPPLQARTVAQKGADVHSKKTKPPVDRGLIDCPHICQCLHGCLFQKVTKRERHRISKREAPPPFRHPLQAPQACAHIGEYQLRLQSRQWRHESVLHILCHLCDPLVSNLLHISSL